MTDPITNAVAPEPRWRRHLTRLQAIAIDVVLWVLALLMIDFLVIAFSGRRGPTGLLVTPEEVLLFLHYGWLVVAAVILATSWHLARGILGAPLGGVLI
ncbi:MAG: hypothetical protein WBG96_02160, partial [Thermoanaerobaculia bacterium]